MSGYFDEYVWRETSEQGGYYMSGYFDEEKHRNRGAIICLDILMKGMVDYW